eukprot:4969754-Karenia_brevis.AAC.1
MSLRRDALHSMTAAYMHPESDPEAAREASCWAWLMMPSMLLRPVRPTKRDDGVGDAGNAAHDLKFMRTLRQRLEKAELG